MILQGVSVAQAIDVWGDLCRAYYGDHPYGGNVAEVYAYRVMAYQPSLHVAMDGGRTRWGDMRGSDAHDAARHNAEVMVDLLWAFSNEFSARIEVQGECFAWEPLCDWIKEQGFHHRWHIRITPGGDR